jgi:hypothetical protein
MAMRKSWYFLKPFGEGQRGECQADFNGSQRLPHAGRQCCLSGNPGRGSGSLATVSHTQTWIVASN